MAKKKSTSEKIESRSVRSNVDRLIGFSACIALILAIVMFVVNLILGAIKADLGIITAIMGLVKDIALGIAVCLNAYYYARNKKKGFKITVYVCIVLYAIFAIFGNLYSIL
ncbi:MAG: hypothetical protein K2G37_05925 [Clostridia bacterium]|nr:hypothetical protein [Clostridia bacterium]MDE7328226.1 hypothetical protein [Clostridia bacterium]